MYEALNLKGCITRNKIKNTAEKGLLEIIKVMISQLKSTLIYDQ